MWVYRRRLAWFQYSDLPDIADVQIVISFADKEMSQLEKGVDQYADDGVTDTDGLPILMVHIDMERNGAEFVLEVAKLDTHV